jgi:hypothetical protein
MSATIVAVAVAKARRRIVKHFTQAGATSAAKAIAYNEPDKRLERRIFQRMLAFGAVKRASEGKYWLDEAKLGDFRKESLAKVLTIIAATGFAAAGAMFLGS